MWIGRVFRCGIRRSEMHLTIVYFLQDFFIIQLNFGNLKNVFVQIIYGKEMAQLINTNIWRRQFEMNKRCWRRKCNNQFQMSPNTSTFVSLSHSHAQFSSLFVFPMTYQKMSKACVGRFFFYSYHYLFTFWCFICCCVDDDKKATRVGITLLM